MMNASLVLVAMLALIGAMLSIAMLIAWRDFGRPPYALIWAAAFGAIALQWIITFGLYWFDLPGRPPASPFQFLQLATSALLAHGFGQRAGRPMRGRWLLVGWVAAVGSGIVFKLLIPHWGLATLLPKLFSAVALISGAAVVTPRGRPPTPAERGATVMLAAFALSELTLGLIGALGGATPSPAELETYRHTSSLSVPATFVGVGLFTVFLIAADLSARMQRLARTDPLTGLLNRRGLDDAIATFSARWARGPRRGSVVLADLDSFKQLNDRCGHLAGDQVLRAFARLGRAGVRRGELIGRIGGEEFALMLPGFDPPDACTRIEALRQATRTIEVPGSPEVRCTASFGIAAMDPALPTLAEAFADALARADGALMRAKDAGRDRVLIADPAPADPVSRP